MQRNTFLTALATSWLGLALGSSALAAANDKPLEWVVGYAAGGGSDVVARAIAESMGTSLGRTIVINNKPGAGTNIAAEYAARSKDYGNLVFSADFATLAANPFLFSKLSYNAEKDFQPVGLLVRFPMFLVVSNQVPVSNYKEFVAWAKTQTDGVNWASAGPGSPHHLVGELFREQSGLKLTHVPYRGAAPAITDVVGGQLPMVAVNALEAVAQVRAGRLKVLAVMSAKRSSLFPEAPTLAESGFAGFEASVWYGLLAPAATPKPVLAQLNAALQKALAQKDVRDKLSAAGGEVEPGSAEAFATLLHTERARYDKAIRAGNIKPD